MIQKKKITLNLTLNIKSKNHKLIHKSLLKAAYKKTMESAKMKNKTKFQKFSEIIIMPILSKNIKLTKNEEEDTQ
jgi:hypothetical protein